MNASPDHSKTRRNLKALFALGLVVTLIPSLSGGLILALGYSHPEVTKPIWEFGQYAMIIGLINLAVYLALIFQVRRLVRGMKTDPIA